MPISPHHPEERKPKQRIGTLLMARGRDPLHVHAPRTPYVKPTNNLGHDEDGTPYGFSTLRRPYCFKALVVKAMSSQKMINNPLLNNEKNFQRL
jgi:hypothetical protein